MDRANPLNMRPRSCDRDNPIEKKNKEDHEALYKKKTILLNDKS
jgi:hypothetical protein